MMEIAHNHVVSEVFDLTPERGVTLEGCEDVPRSALVNFRAQFCTDRISSRIRLWLALPILSSSPVPSPPPRAQRSRPPYFSIPLNIGGEAARNRKRPPEAATMYLAVFCCISRLLAASRGFWRLLGFSTDVQ
jgi:hypothetical protein